MVGSCRVQSLVPVLSATTQKGAESGASPIYSIQLPRRIEVVGRCRMKSVVPDNSIEVSRW